MDLTDDELNDLNSNDDVDDLDNDNNYKITDNDSIVTNYDCAIASNFNLVATDNIPTSFQINNEQLNTPPTGEKNTCCTTTVDQLPEPQSNTTTGEQNSENKIDNNRKNTLESDNNTTTEPNLSDLCRAPKRPSTLVIRTFSDNNNDRCNSTNDLEAIVTTPDRASRRRPTLILGDICIIPTENPAVNDRRLSKLAPFVDAAKGSSANNNTTATLRLLKKMSSLVMDSKEGSVSVTDLPLTFHVKYLGHYPAKGLWGIKHTRGPVDTMVKAAKNLPSNQVLPFIKVTISTKGITLVQQNSKGIKTENFFSIETISYGVQDLVYTRVFSMIVVYEDLKDHHPFECHAFVCESRNAARKLTYALAAAFQDYSKRVQEMAKHDPNSPIKKKFAIDLRSPEELQEDMEAETEA